MSLVLFDIDGTLLLSGGAGVRAMTRAFKAVFGVADAFAHVDLGGRTDTYLLSNALTAAGLPDSRENHHRFRDAYIAILSDEIAHPGTGRRGVMPGVESLLARMQATGGFHLALLTGNYEPAAHIKLSHFGLRHYFDWGVYGEESVDRDDLGRLAVLRARERAVPPTALSRAVVLGDTPFDIACARAAGARAIGVATGSHSVATLEAAGADVAFQDLKDTERVLECLR